MSLAVSTCVCGVDISQLLPNIVQSESAGATSDSLMIQFAHGQLVHEHISSEQRFIGAVHHYLGSKIACSSMVSAR